MKNSSLLQAYCTPPRGHLPNHPNHPGSRVNTAFTLQHLQLQQMQMEAERQHLKRKRDEEERKRKENEKPHVKKPLNAFMLFMKEQRQKVVQECTLKESAAINQILGRKWHSLSKEEQQVYYDKARKAREEHLSKYPDWSARDNYGKRKRRKKDVKSVGASPHGQGQYGQAQHGSNHGHGSGQGSSGVGLNGSGMGFPGSHNQHQQQQHQHTPNNNQGQVQGQPNQHNQNESNGMQLGQNSLNSQQIQALLVLGERIL